MSSLRSKVMRQIEAASTETAKKSNHEKIVKKVAEYVKKLGIDSTEWKAVSDSVFRQAFSKK